MILIALTALGTWSISPTNARQRRAGPSSSVDAAPAAVRRDDLALGVVGHGRLRPAGSWPGSVLSLPDQVGQQPGRPLHADHQHPGRHRVERAGVPDPAGAGQPAHPGDHVVRGHAARLVDHDEPVARHAQPPRRALARVLETICAKPLRPGR